MRIPARIEYILQKLAAAGYEGYLVGGCVRDFLLGREPSDFDITTSALPEETMAVFAEHRVIPTGLKHGTVTVMHEGEPFEITTYRTETTYADGRHPDNVSFTRSLREDLCRRDFTVNAMAMGLDGEVVDLYGGREDLAAGIIRAVGEPTVRFTEDALRILRAFRFAAKLGFAIEENTLAAATALAPRLSLVSRERIFEELSKLLCGKCAGQILTVMYDGGVFDCIFEKPKIRKDSFLDIDSLPCRADIRLSSILLGDGNFAEHVRSLKPSTAFFTQVQDTLLCALPDGMDAATLYRAVYRYGASPLSDRALIAGCKDLHEAVTALVEKADCLAVRDLAVTGEDVLAKTAFRGKDIKTALEKVLFAVFDGEIPNTREAQLEYLCAMR